MKNSYYDMLKRLLRVLLISSLATDFISAHAVAFVATHPAMMPTKFFMAIAGNYWLIPLWGGIAAVIVQIVVAIAQCRYRRWISTIRMGCLTRPVEF